MTKTKTIEVVYEDGVFKPLEPVEMKEGTKIPIKITKRDLLKEYRGVLGKVDEKLLKRFELEANDIH
ncbi:MAG: antitoxin family protein [Methanophagales archaeon]|nr:antitoxin family protein [Methanophagales archaeon]